MRYIHPVHIPGYTNSSVIQNFDYEILSCILLRFQNVIGVISIKLDVNSNVSFLKICWTIFGTIVSPEKISPLPNNDAAKNFLEKVKNKWKANWNKKSKRETNFDTSTNIASTFTAKQRISYFYLSWVVTRSVGFCLLWSFDNIS